MHGPPEYLHLELLKKKKSQYSWPLVSNSSLYCFGGIKEVQQSWGAGWPISYDSHALVGCQVPLAEALNLTFLDPVLREGGAD